MSRKIRTTKFIIRLVAMNDHLQFFIRHQQQFLQDKLVLVFKSDAARDYIKNALPNCVFEELTKEQAQHAVRIGIKGQVIPYGYTMKLTTSEMTTINIEGFELNQKQKKLLLKELKEEGIQTEQDLAKYLEQYWYTKDMSMKSHLLMSRHPKKRNFALPFDEA